ncbi:hypothetical protein EYD10_07007 [Varanus komodoensis]|nr:hypothetical protein EYD10_07007 [Varanus komodoensis]
MLVFSEQTLLEYAEKWKTSEDPLPLLEVYTEAIRSYVKARPYLTSECENVTFVLERLALSYAELLLCLPPQLPENKWKEFQSFIQMAHTKLMQNGSCQLHFLSLLAQENGTWKNPILCSILSQESLDEDKVNEFLAFEGPMLLDIRIKHLMKSKQLTQATALAKLCSNHPEISSKGNFKQTYLVCLCSGSPNEKLMQEIADIDCKDALEMICNLESEGDEKSALILCAAFLSRQLQQGEMYCAWELTLFWSKLQQRVEPSVQIYLERCRQLSVLTKTVYHIFFLIKVINSEIDAAGLATCIELCVKALRLEASENTEVKISICKTISCLLPDDLEVKRACQLSEFLLEPTVDAYYAVEMLYNQPDQKYDEENLPIPNSLRCELLLVLKTHWPFDPEFWDWKMLKRQCLALMGEEASIVSSIDELNDTEMHEKVEDCQDENKETPMNGLSGCFDEATNLLRGIRDKKQKNREIKKLRERGFISARFRNWQAYMQYCVLCDKEFLGHRIVRHAQKHYKDGIYSCPICAQNFNSKETFVPHVTLHVKKSSKERLAAMKPLRKLGRPPKTVTTGVNKKNTVVKQEQRHIKKNSLYAADFIVFNDNDGSDDENYEKDKPYIPEIVPVQKPLPVNEFTCPVTLCKKGFKYFKNLIAHAKGHKDSEEAKRFLEMQSKKVICQYCRRHFVSVTHLNDHLQMHCGSKPYICIQMKCKASFNSYAELLSHRKEHPVFKAKCMFPKCGRVFSEAYLLYDHEAQHYNTFTCKLAGCGKVYRSQNELEKHIEDHTKSEKVPQSDSGNIFSQPLEDTVNVEEIPPKEETLVLPPDNSINNCAKADNYISDQVKDESLENERTKISTSVLEQTDTVSTETVEQPVTSSAKADSLVLASNVLMPLLGQKIRENMAKKGKLLSRSNKIDTEAPVIQQLCSTVEDSCSDLAVFQQGKEDDCVSQSQDISMNSVKPEPEIFATKDSEKERSHMPFSVENQVGYQNLLSPKLQLEESIKTATDLYNLPLKTLEGITLAPAQNSIGTPFVPVIPLATPVQKFTCQVEGCTRIYNSSQSIGKHMKTAHPDQYASFKMQRKNKKSRKTSSSQNLPNDSKIVYFLPSQVAPTADAFPQQTQTSLNSTCTSQLQQLSNALFPTRLENMTNSLLPNVENPINTGLSSHIKSEPENTLGSQIGSLSNATLPSQLDDLEKPVMPLNIDSGSDPFLPLPAENGPISLFPSPADNGPSSVFSQMENNTNHFSSQLEGNTSSSFSKDESVDVLFSSQMNNENNFSETTPQPLVLEKAKKDRRRGVDGKDKKPKHNKRAKWPAIIRDGKFICSRCYRVFSNPRSLGGHLSKRSYCKPLDESEICPETLQLNGQSSLLASMILSSNALTLQQQQQSAFSPEACFKEPSFLQLLATENRSAAFLQNLFPRTNVTNFNASEEGNEIIKQALETAGIPSTFDSTEILPHLITTSCITGTTQINATVLPSPGMSPLLPAVCNPTTLLTDQNRTLNTKISSIEECSNVPVFPDDLILKTIENSLCSSVVSNSVAAHNFGNNTSRVSVINSIKSSELCSLNKKGISGSKKKKKTAAPLGASNFSQKLVPNDLTALGLLARNIEGSVQISTENFQSDVLANCEAQVLMDNLTQKLSSVDNELTPNVKENLKTSHETDAEIVPLVKTENSDSQVTLSSCIQENPSLEISEDNVIQNFEKTLEIIKTAMNSEMVEVKTEIQEVSIESLQSPQSSAVQCVPETGSQNVKTSHHTQHIVHTQNIPLTKLSSSQSETSHKDDIQIMEILEGLKKLKLESEASSQELGNIIHCLPTDAVMPQILIPVVTTESTSLVQPSSETHTPFEKVHKPFMCQAPSCNYSAMTKDALFKHYSKIHQYTPEMILEIKKHQLKYAPFKCVVATCPKTFTRNSNLRAHCQLVHHFTTEEMVKLKLKRPYGRRSQNKTAGLTPRPVELKSIPYVLTENRNESQLTKEPEIRDEICIQSVKALERVISERVIPENIPNAPEKLEKLPEIVSIPLELHNIATLSNTQVQPKVRKIRRHRKEKEEKKHKKPVRKSLEFPTTYSPYRPYRCVHQGCFAAFTIQQNLILHYQAVHKSDLPSFSLEAEEENEPSREEDTAKEEECDETETTVKEFRCEVRNCSRIFQEVTSLIQHYMKLHEMTPEEVGSMKSSLDVGRFPCDQSECKSSFTAYVNYITHLEADHGIKIKQNKTEDGMYKCDCEGCDRIYATRSNLLRHIFNKHNDRHKDHLIRPRRFLTPGQENISIKANQEKNMKMKHKGLKYRAGKNGNKISIRAKRKRAITIEKNSKMGQIPENKAYSLKCGKYAYSIKARDDALSECTSKFVIQYPCMIKGCSSVVTSENNIIRHYKCHKLSKAFTSQHRSLLIVSNKHSDSPEKEVSLQNETTEDKTCDVKELQPHLSETCEDPRPSPAVAPNELEKSEKDEVDELAELFITKLINEDLTSSENHTKTSSDVNSESQETNSCLSEKQSVNGNFKRANKEKYPSQTKKRKVEKQEEILAVELSSVRREEETAVAIQTSEEQSSAFDWSSFKPMGFEVSFLKFLEESAVKQKKNTERGYNCGNRKGSHSNSRKSNDKNSLARTRSCSESETYVQFANPSQFQCSGTVKIVLDKTFKDCTERVLKQLQEMKPIVNLIRHDGHWEANPEVTK